MTHQVGFTCSLLFPDFYLKAKPSQLPQGSFIVFTIGISKNPTSILTGISECVQQNFRLWSTFCQVKKRQSRVVSLGRKSIPGRVKTSSLPVRFR